jgi:chromate reductase, NAD(P)H dehydrogenase (quinone)
MPVLMIHKDKQQNILAIIGSASKHSANHRLVQLIAEYMQDDYHFDIINHLKELPHFDPELSIEQTPEEIINFRTAIEQADAILICSPEYIFSVPSGLKNALEWCVVTTVFAQKPIGIITASASGQKAHEELKLIMKTLDARFKDETTLLIQGIKGKINENNMISDPQTEKELRGFIVFFNELIKSQAVL